MNINFAQIKMQKQCTSMRAMERSYGRHMAARLMQRLEELNAADALSDLSHLSPTRCHDLVGNRKGQFSVDLVHPYRLIFEPDMAPIPTLPNGGIDRTKIRDILIIEIADTH